MDSSNRSTIIVTIRLSNTAANYGKMMMRMMNTNNVIDERIEKREINPNEKFTINSNEKSSRINSLNEILENYLRSNVIGMMLHTRTHSWITHVLIELN